MYLKKTLSQRKIWFVLILIINTNIVFCQKNKKENNLIKTRKKTIIKIANTILKNKYPALKINLSSYEITAWANKNDTLVYYNKTLKFIPLGYKRECFNYNFTVNIITKEIPYLDISGTSKFYTPTKKDIEKINFIKKIITLKPGFDNEVFEDHNKYIISTSNDIYFIIYHIDKVTGKEIPQSFIQGNWEPNPFLIKDIDPLIKIVK